MHRSLLILLFSALLITGGCGGEPSETDRAKRVRVAALSEDQALARARPVVRENDPLADPAENPTHPPRDSGGPIHVRGPGGGVF